MNAAQQQRKRDFMIYLIIALIIAAVIGISIVAYRKIQTLPQPLRKRVYIIGGSVIVGCVLVIGAIHIITSIINKPLSVEEHLLGEWIAENENGEASIIFKENNDGDYSAEWSIYDYTKKEWLKTNFIIKDIDNHIMTILLDDGKIQFIPFAVSKDTLFFDGTGYKNYEKNVPIPDGEYAYIVDGVILPVDKCYMGMSRDEVEKALDPLEVKHSKPDSYCMLPVDGENEIKISFYFDDNYGLEEIHYWLEDYYEQKNSLIDMLSDKYGDYEKSKWSGFDNYYRYTWHSGNLIIDLNEDIEEKQIWLEFSIDLDWQLEYRRKNRN